MSKLQTELAMCPECDGTGWLLGFSKLRECQWCEGKGRIDVRKPHSSPVLADRTPNRKETNGRTGKIPSDVQTSDDGTIPQGGN